MTKQSRESNKKQDCFVGRNDLLATILIDRSRQIAALQRCRVTEGDNDDGLKHYSYRNQKYLFLTYPSIISPASVGDMKTTARTSISTASNSTAHTAAPPIAQNL